MKKILYRSALILLSTTLLAGCGIFDKETDETVGWSAPQLYNAARESVRESEWKSARRYLTAVESRYPYSSYAQQSMIDQAYVNWKDDEPEKATVVINRFMSIYPNHPGTDYMLYLKGMVTFTPPSAFLTSYTGQDPSERDPKGLRQSYQAFKQLVDEYPDSRYAPDARQRLVWLVSTIADNEANVAEYYFKRDGYVAAINRSQRILRDFSGVQASERALYIMMLSYEKLNMPEQAADAKRVLDQNFPDSKYYNSGLDKNRSFWSFLNPTSWFN